MIERLMRDVPDDHLSRVEVNREGAVADLPRELWTAEKFERVPGHTAQAV